MVMTLKEIEHAVAQLPPEKLKEFRKWYVKFDAELWDEQIECDIVSGKLDEIAARAVADHEAGKSKSL